MMSSYGTTALLQVLSDEEYLDLEKKTGLKYELLEGEVFPVPQANFNHRIIAGNFNQHLGRLLRGRCLVGSADLRLKVEATGLLTYPDVFVTRGDLTMVDPGTTFINPILIGEVLAPVSELYDRTIKFAHYRQIPTLSTYILVSQNAPHVEIYTRETDTKWLLTTASGPHATVELASLKIALSLADIYSGVEFPDSGDSLRPIRR
ncbi:MAG TPA: Uma2 family endonuclease [Verrucomicrobiae bacterium]